MNVRDKRHNALVLKKVQQIVNTKNRCANFRINITDHFIERVTERLTEEDLDLVVRIIKAVVANHACEIFFTAALGIIRFEAKRENITVCFTVNFESRLINFRTVIKNKASGDYSGFTIHKFEL